MHHAEHTPSNKTKHFRPLLRIDNRPRVVTFPEKADMWWPLSSWPMYLLSVCRNTEVQFAGAFSEKGSRHTLHIRDGEAHLLGRQIVKSPSATVTIPELEFEIPPLTQRGVITTIEGLLSEASSGLGCAPTLNPLTSNSAPPPPSPPTQVPLPGI